MQFAQYPLFQPLGIEHQEVLEAHWRDDPPQISEFTFANLFAWRRAYEFAVCRYDDFIILRSGRPQAPRFFPLVGRGNGKRVMEELLAEPRAVFCRLPREVAGWFAGDTRWLVSGDPDNSDYVYARDDLGRLTGRKYDGKRNLIRKFKMEHAYAYQVLSESDAAACLDYEERWCLVKGCDRVEGLRQEGEAMRDMVGNFTRFHLIAGAIKIAGVMCAVAIGQQLNERTLVMHILKADPAIVGLYQTMLQEFMLRQADAVELVNLEQDLGIEGLRAAKRSYHPLAMVEKYNISAVG